MPARPVIAIFDVGKTNKKLLLFNAQYKVVYEATTCFAEITDEDGYPCEDLRALQLFVQDSLHQIFKNKAYNIKAINVAAYGASLVHIDADGEPTTPLYNYLKPFPEALQQQFYQRYGGAETVAVTTASPMLGSLNSGLQLYRIKREQPHLFQKIKWTLHLPQYLSYLITSKTYSDITSIGCHTALWDFEKGTYHQWVHDEGILEKLPPIHSTDKTVHTSVLDHDCAVGLGVHDSSAALIPYHINFHEPFMLLSTGTWCISLNPFNASPLTTTELQQDCLCYLDYKGRPVKASRLFLGPQYDAGVVRLCEHFNQSSGRYNNVLFDANLLTRITQNALWDFEKVSFADCDLRVFENDIEAYHGLMLQLLKQQQQSTNLVVKKSLVKHLFVDGGFSKNDVYMNLLAAFFPEQEVYAASMAQGTALGAALAIHNSWNKSPVPSHIVDLKRYARMPDVIV